jgi:hypothetical protein
MLCYIFSSWFENECLPSVRYRLCPKKLEENALLYGQGVMLTTHPLLVPRLRKSRSYTSCHPEAPLWTVTGPFYLYLTLGSLSNPSAADVLKLKDEKIKAVFLPKNTTALIHSIDQGIIQACRACYGELLGGVVNSELQVTEFLKTLMLNDVTYIAGVSLGKIMPAAIVNCRKITLEEMM